MKQSIKSFIQNFLLKLSSNSIFFYKLSKKFYNIIYHFFCWYISYNEKLIDSFIPAGSYGSGDFIPWKSDIDVSIIISSKNGMPFINIQKRIYRKTRIFNFAFPIIKHIHIIPKNTISLGLFSLVPPFISIRSKKNKLYGLHKIICAEEYFDRIFFFLSSGNLKYLSSVRNFLRRNGDKIIHESIVKLRLLSELKTDLHIVVDKYERELFDKKLAALKKKLGSEAFFITYHHSYLTTEIWTVFLLKTSHQKKLTLLIDKPPLIKNILNFIPYKYLPYLKNVVHTKFICHFYKIQLPLLKYISKNTHPIPSLLDEILIFYNFLRTLTEPIDFPYGINFDRHLNKIRSYRVEHFKGILFSLLNFQSYIQDRKYYLSPQSIVLEKKYSKYRECLNDLKIDYRKLLEHIYQQKKLLFYQTEEFFKSNRLQNLLKLCQL
jgi:hypothetical protein